MRFVLAAGVWVKNKQGVVVTAFGVVAGFCVVFVPPPRRRTYDGCGDY